MNAKLKKDKHITSSITRLHVNGSIVISLNKKLYDSILKIVKLRNIGSEYYYNKAYN